jgi:hypothetical protein
LTSIFACFAKPDSADCILSGKNCRKDPTNFKPELSDCGDYYNGCTDGFEPIIIEQYFHPLEERQLLLNQEFILLLELYKEKDENYYSINDSGEKEKVVEFSINCVKIKTKYLLQYMSAKQLLYVQFIESCVSSSESYTSNLVLIDEQNHLGETYNYFNRYKSDKDHTYILSAIYASSIVKPQPVHTCGIWPYDKVDEYYPEYIIKELPDGTYVRHSCKKSETGNYFGANPDAPHYLTPVYFHPNVLDKYRKNPLFTVSERRLSCGTQWGVKIDNLTPERVMVFLGDLGRDLPEKERKHFLQHEMPPTDQSISDEVVANDFYCLHTEPSGPISKFMKAYGELHESWIAAFGRNLWRELHGEDKDIPERIRIPSNDSPEEFETVVLNVTKMLVDYIDEAQFCSNQKGSINKLENFLKDKKVVVDLSVFRDLQKLRSSRIAHSKGSNYENLKNSLLVGNAINDTMDIVSRLTDCMASLADAIKGCSTQLKQYANNGDNTPNDFGKTADRQDA